MAQSYNQRFALHIRKPSQRQINSGWYNFWERFPKGWGLDMDFDGTYVTPVTGRGKFILSLYK